MKRKDTGLIDPIILVAGIVMMVAGVMTKSPIVTGGGLVIGAIGLYLIIGD